MSTVTARAAAGSGRVQGALAGRVGNLDVLRALAALAVLAGHAYFLSGRLLPVKAHRVTDVPLITLTSGVWLFFALSGYVISRPFIDALVTGRPLPAPARYLRRRAGRIFPLYWVTVTIFVLIAGHPGVAVWQFPAHYLLLNNLLPGQQATLYSVAWTLTLEVLFYLLVPVLAGVARARWGRPSPALLARVILTGWALSIAFTGVADLQGDGIGGLWLRGSLAAMWQMFCPGLMLALAPHLAPGRVRAALTAPEPRRPAWWLPVGVCLTAGALLAAIAPLRFGIDVYQLLVDAARPLFAVGYGLIVAAAIAARPWEHRGLVKLGAASYGIYLLHPLIATAMVKLGLVPLARDSVLSFAVHVLVLLILTVPVALASWRWLERPSIRWARGRGEGRGSRQPSQQPTQQMRDFWNRRAREDALYFVDNRRPYRAPEAGEFWDAAPLLEHFLGGLGVALAASDDVLEIGCGVGRMTRVLAAQGGHVAALDVSDEMLARARDLNPDLANVRWELGDGVSLSGLTADSFDACVSTVVLQHVPDPEITLGYVRELGRVLRPGGWAALQVSTDPDVHRPRAGLRRQLVAAVGRGPRGQRHPAWLGAPVSLAALQATAVASGLSLERVWGAGSQYCQILLRRA